MLPAKKSSFSLQDPRPVNGHFPFGYYHRPTPPTPNPPTPPAPSPTPPSSPPPTHAVSWTRVESPPASTDPQVTQEPSFLVARKELENASSDCTWRERFLVDVGRGATKTKFLAVKWRFPTKPQQAKMQNAFQQQTWFGQRSGDPPQVLTCPQRSWQPKVTTFWDLDQTIRSKGGKTEGQKVDSLWARERYCKGTGVSPRDLLPGCKDASTLFERHNPGRSQRTCCCLWLDLRDRKLA